MKANKIFAVALAALTLVGFNACNKQNNPDEPGKEGDLTLDKTSINLEVEEEETITATIAVSFESSNPQVATVTPANDGKSAKVKAIAEGSAVITAKSQGGQVKTCIVAVKKKGGEGGETVQLKGSQVWPIALDGTTADANASKIVADFRPNDVDQFLYVWQDGAVYEAGEGKGLNFHGNTDGYTALKVTNLGWAGAGFCLTADGNGWQAAEALRAAIVANPDQYFLHMAMKSTDNYSHCFAAGVNVFVVLTEGVQGAELNLDAVYFYKK